VASKYRAGREGVGYYIELQEDRMKTKKAALGPPGNQVVFEVVSCESCPYGPLIPDQQYCLKSDMRPLSPDWELYPEWCELPDWED